MHFSTLLTLGFAHLPILSTAAPHRAGINSLSFIPDKVIWHDASTANPSTIPANTTLQSTSNATTASPKTFPVVGVSNFSACSGIVYDHTSPARTAVVRDDCYKLAQQVRAAPGFWELYKWSRDDDSARFIPLVSDGTCEFAVKRRHMPVGFNSSTSDVVIIGNHDVFKILNASVYDLAHAADEPFVDAERNQGHMDCKWSYAVNASMEFRIQKTGTK